MLAPLYNPTSSSLCIVIDEEYKNDVPTLECGYDGDFKINGDFKEVGGSDTSDTVARGDDTNDTVDVYVVDAVLHGMIQSPEDYISDHVPEDNSGLKQNVTQMSNSDDSNDGSNNDWGKNEGVSNRN